MAVFPADLYKSALDNTQIFHQIAYKLKPLVSKSPSLATLLPVPLTTLLLQLQEAFQVKPNFKFEGCSSKVAAALGPDVMKSVKHLIPDLLSALPVLLYQGMSNAFINVVACHHLHLGTYHSNAIYGIVN